LSPRWPLLVLLAATPATAAEVTLLVSADVPAWRPAVEAIRSAPGHQVQVVDLGGSRELGARVLAGLAEGVTLVAMGPLAVQVAAGAPAGMPVIHCMVVDARSLGLAGPDVTGVAFSLPVLNQLGAFSQVNPAARRLGVIYSDETRELVEQARAEAGRFRLELVAREATSEREVPAAVRALLAGDDEPVDAVWLLPDPILSSEAALRFLFAQSLEGRRPVYAFSPALVEQGAMVSLAPDVASVGAEVVRRIARIESGEAPGRMALGIPLQELTINKRIADRLGVKIPPAVLREASRVIE
jgi:putative ABC transport system substrate-binding protein